MAARNLKPVKASSKDDFEGLEAEVESGGFTRAGKYRSLEALIKAAEG